LLVVAAKKYDSDEKSGSQSREHFGEGFGGFRYESGHEKFEACKRKQGYKVRAKVCDADKLLSPADKNMIKTALYELKKQTSSFDYQREDEQNNKYDGIKLSVFVMKNVQDPKETDEKAYELVKQHAEKYPFERAAVLVFALDSADFSERQRFRQQQFGYDNKLNTPVYYKLQSGNGFGTFSWVIFYSTASINDKFSFYEIKQIYEQKATQEFHQGTYGNVIRDIVYGIRDKAMTAKQTGKNAFFSSEQKFNGEKKEQFGNNYDEMQKVEQCLKQFEYKQVCDPDNVLGYAQKQQVEKALYELEYATKEAENQKQQLTGRWMTCKHQGGIKLTTIVLKNVYNEQFVDQKIIELLQKQNQINSCDRYAVFLFNTGFFKQHEQNFEAQKREFQEQSFGGQTVYYYKYFDGTWAKFYGGPQNLDTQISASEITNFYAQQEPAVRRNDYGQALEGFFREYKERVQQQLKQRFTRDADSEKQEKSEGQDDNKKEETVKMLEECLKEIDQPKVCDPSNLLENEDREKVQKTLEQIQQQSGAFKKDGQKSAKKFITTFVLLPYTDDTAEHDKKILQRLTQYTKEQKDSNYVAVMMLSAKKGDKNGPSKFYGAATDDAPVKHPDFLQFYNENKGNIRYGEHAKALSKIANKVLQQAANGQSQQKDF
jgi:hypothetical protein